MANKFREKKNWKTVNLYWLRKRIQVQTDFTFKNFVALFQERCSCDVIFIGFRNFLNSFEALSLIVRSFKSVFYFYFSEEMLRVLILKYY